VHVRRSLALAAIVLGLAACQSTGASTAQPVATSAASTTATTTPATTPTSASSTPSATASAPQGDTPAVVDGDDWKIGTPEKHGLSAATLASAVDKVVAKYPQTTSVVIAVDGELVFERYAPESGVDTAMPVYSVSKSILSALVGISMQDKSMPGLDTRLAKLVPQFGKAGAAVQGATLRDALTMRVGLKSVDDTMDQMWGSPDWVDYIVTRPVIAKPGTTYTYNTGVSHLVSVALAKQVGKTTEEYAREKLFGPIGIDTVQWDTDPQGNSTGGTGVSLTTRDMARFGQLYLDNGRWDGKQIVPAKWVAESTVPRVKSTNQGKMFGYFWWPTTWKIGGKQVRAVEAIGWGGQRVAYVPALHAVIAMTTGTSPFPPPNDDATPTIAAALTR
jgi:CubicO group peptidase (beta-lactamase class C family)